MTTPICNFINKYNGSNPVRLHMPGHKGKAVLGCESLDITEIDGADVLCNASGIIKESEENASQLFGTKRTFYSAEGSSLSIRAMLYLLKLYAAQKCEKPRILAGRNAHKVFITSCALLDIEVNWIFPETESYLSCDISKERLEEILSSLPKKPTALYLTSPDYLGNIADIKALSEVCHKHNILLATDNAHGAYLNFLPENRHPINLGADICCDSAHKTLPCLTGSGYLHISKSAPDFFSEMAKKAMSLFASTSPSYLILQSLDMANVYLEENFRFELSDFIKEVQKLKTDLTGYGYEIYGNEELKIIIKPKSYGYTGQELSKELEKENIYVEFSDPDFLVMMLTPQNETASLEKVKKALLALPRKAAIETAPPKMALPKQKISPNTALFSKSVTVRVSESIGRVLASATVSCPPAIPIVSLGEVIDETAVKVFEYYGVEEVSVVEL